MWNSDRYAEFLCPLCGTDAYTRVTVQKPNGQYYVTEFYHCFGCSVMFTNPVSFTQQRQVIGNQPITSGRYGVKATENAADEDAITD